MLPGPDPPNLLVRGRRPWKRSICGLLSLPRRFEPLLLPWRPTRTIQESDPIFRKRTANGQPETGIPVAAPRDVAYSAACSTFCWAKKGKLVTDTPMMTASSAETITASARFLDAPFRKILRSESEGTSSPNRRSSIFPRWMLEMRSPSVEARRSCHSVTSPLVAGHPLLPEGGDANT